MIPSTVKPILLKEQHGLCAYCQQKLTDKRATIEHLICQSHHMGYSLSYHNMFAVCQGNQGGGDDSHCDKYRANKKNNDYFYPFMLMEACQTKSWDMPNPFFEACVFVLKNKQKIVTGKIRPKKAQSHALGGYPVANFKKHIEHALAVLNLNALSLVEARQGAWEGACQLREHQNLTWEELFGEILQDPGRPFREFLLSAIRQMV